MKVSTKRVIYHPLSGRWALPRQTLIHSLVQHVKIYSCPGPSFSRPPFPKPKFIFHRNPHRCPALTNKLWSLVFITGWALLGRKAAGNKFILERTYLWFKHAQGERWGYFHPPGSGEGERKLGKESLFLLYWLCLGGTRASLSMPSAASVDAHQVHLKA